MNMESNQIMMKEKLEFFGIIKEALSILTKNPKFIILTLVTSLPLFCFLLLHEVVFQQTLVETIKILTYDPRCPGFYFCYGYTGLGAIRKLYKELSHRIILSGILYLVIVVHLLDLLNTITTVYSASVIYAGEQMKLKEMLCNPIKKVGFKGPLFTSIYALILASLTIIGLVSLATNIYLTSFSLFMVIFGVLFIALLKKYIEWSAIWNTGIVISIVEEKHGDVALGVSAYISRGNRKCGFLLMLVFFVWRLSLRLSCLYFWWQNRGSGVLVIVTIGQVCLVCLENVMKWVAFMVYFYDCKKRFLEKKIDMEEGRAATTVKK